MKKFIGLIFISVFSLSSFGQDSVKTRIKEYYLTLADFSPVTLQLKYKRQIGKKTYIKIGLVNLSAYSNEQQLENPNFFPTYNSGFSGGLELGIEFRKQLTKKFSVFHGPNLSFSYLQNMSKTLNPAIPTSQQKSISESYRGSIPYSLGILFNLNSNILVSAEINPNINYNYQTYKNGQNPQANNISQNINIGFDNRIVLLSIVYRI
ncbi:MAG: hypothetical protein SFY56_04855 [Bacteroidota bacterium]|nr:hypothetical protein [Bacteroidota bacterium]